MSTTTLTPAADAVIESAMKLSVAERRAIAWQLIQSVHPELRPEMFNSSAEVTEYLNLTPGAIVGGS